MDNKDYALQYLRRGLSVIPLKSPSMVSKDLPKDEFIRQCKVPLIGWKEFQTRLPTEEEVCGWFDKWPNANIGIVTGKISGIVVFDLDSDHAVQYAEDEGGFHYTPKVQTGKGFHCYMQYPDFEVRNDVRKELDIDIRGDGGYVVAPPSIHGSGNQYDWEQGVSIFDLKPAPCESWMIDYLKEVATASAKKPVKANDTGKKEKKSEAENTAPDTTKLKYVEILENGCVQGERNATAARLIGYFLKNLNHPREAWQLTRLWNTRNNPPLDESELKRTFKSIVSREAQKRDNEKGKIDVANLLDTPQKIVGEYTQSYLCVPFGGSDLSNLQKLMGGGLIGGRFYLLGGVPSASKTMLLNNMADNICLNDHPVLFFSYDDGKNELRYRTFSRFTNHKIDDFNQNKLTGDDIRTISNDTQIKKIISLKYVIEQMILVEKWNSLIEQIQKRHEKAPVIIIDYLRKLRTESSSKDERLRVDNILSRLTDLAKQYNIPIVAISELARDSYKGGQRLTMASFKESGSIEYEASWLGILAVIEDKEDGYALTDNWERKLDADGKVDLIVLKAKRGTGHKGRIPLKINKTKMTVADRDDPAVHDSVTPMTKKSMFG